MTIGIGVVGAGFISDYHLRALGELADADVRVVGARRLERAAAQARRYHVPRATDDLSEVLSSAEVDAVVVATPDHTHHEITLAALRAGKAVLVQKPLAPTSEQAEELVVAAEESGVVLCVAFMHRFVDEAVTLAGLIREGALGELHMVRLRNATGGAGWSRWFYERPEHGAGGVAMQLGVHGIDLLLHLFGDIDAVSGCAGRHLEHRELDDGSVVAVDTDDYALAHYELAGGLVASHEMSHTEVAGCDRFRLEVYGSEGTAWLRQPTPGLSVYTSKGPFGSGWHAPDLPGVAPGRRQHESFLAQVRGEIASDESAVDAVQGLAVVEALHRSALSRSWEAVRTRRNRSGR